MLLPDVLALLRCPVCHAELAREPAGGIRCEGCGRVYPVVDGIPVLLAPAAAGGNGSEKKQPL